MELPGSFSGMLISPRPERGPLASQRVVGDLHQAGGQRLQRAVREQQRFVRGQGLELVGRRHEGRAGGVRQVGRDLGAELRMRVQARAHGGAADGQLVQARQRGADLLLGQVQLGHVARDFLAQRQRRGVLQVGATDLDDVVELGALGGQRGAQGLQRRQQMVLDLNGGGHVHGGGEGIVGRLAAIDVVVRMDLARFAALAAQQLGGAVGQHLVHVHIALRARAGLPHGRREFVRPLAGDHFVGGARDGIGDLRIQLAQVGVHLGGGALELRHRGDQRRGHLLGRDREEMQRALGLGAPQVVLGTSMGPKVSFSMRVFMARTAP